jgi:hypothetical protein
MNVILSTDGEGFLRLTELGEAQYATIVRSERPNANAVSQLVNPHVSRNKRGCIVPVIGYLAETEGLSTICLSTKDKAYDR